jgi:hypothetical protein
MLVERLAVFSTQVEEVLGVNMCPPRSFSHSVSVGTHPPWMIAEVSYPLVLMRTFTFWGGFPIWIAKEDHGPSLPSPVRQLIE